MSRRARRALRKRTLSLMATAPTTTNPVTPGPGVQMPDGFSSKIVFALYPTCPFWELVPKFGGVDGGAPIKLSSMRNTLWHTAAARTLLMAEDTEVEVSFQPDLWNKVVSHLLNQNGSVTEWFPDGSSLSYYGWLGKLGQMSMQEGELPKCGITIHKSCRDASGNEVGPVMTPATGT
jgi:hypothetical protein